MKRASSAEIVIVLATLLVSVIGGMGNVWAANPSVTEITDTNGHSFSGGTITLKTDSFSGGAESILIGDPFGAIHKAGDPDQQASGTQYTVTVNTGGNTPVFVFAGSNVQSWTFTSPSSLTIVVKSVTVSISVVLVGLALNVQYSGFTGFDGVYLATNAQSISCNLNSPPILNCDVTGDSSVAGFVDIYIPGDTIPPGNLQVTLTSGGNKVIAVSGGIAQGASGKVTSSSVTNPAPSNRQVTKAPHTPGVLIDIQFGFSTPTVGIQNVAAAGGGIPEYPLEPVPILALMGALASFFLIRRRIRE